MKMKNIVTVLCVIFMFLILAVGCGDFNSGSSDSNDNNNGTEEVETDENNLPSLSLNINFKTASDYGYSISKVTSKITKGTLTKEIELTVDNSNQTATGKFEKLAIGEYTVEIKAYDGETQIAEGSGTATIEKDQEATVEITLEYFTGDLAINVNLDDGNIDEFPTDGLVAYYPLNGNANDESGNGNNGTVNGAALSNEGIIGNCLSFSNNSDNVMTGVNLSTSVFTLNIWAKQTDSEKISLGGTLTNPSFGKSGFMFHSGGYGGATAGSATILSWQSNQVWINFYGTEQVIVSDWNMYTFVYVAGGISKIYSNGVLTATLLNTPTNPTHSSPFQIGRSFTTITAVNQVWGGLIDEVGIWNIELTQEEITAIYNSGSGLEFP